MKMPGKTFWIGLGAGLALCLLLVQLWSSYFTRTIADNSQPRLLRPLSASPRVFDPNSSSQLPRPWFPQSTANVGETWHLFPVNGHSATIPSFRGRVLFLNFWSTSCQPCLEEMPGISRLRNSLQGAPIAFAAVTDEDRTAVVGFLAHHNVGVPIFFTKRPFPEEFLVEGVPTTFILDREGTIVFRHVGPLNWDDDAARVYLRNLAGLQTPH